MPFERFLDFNLSLTKKVKGQRSNGCTIYLALRYKKGGMNNFGLASPGTVPGERLSVTLRFLATGK